MATPRVVHRNIATGAICLLGVAVVVAACSGDDTADPTESSSVPTAPPDGSSPDTVATRDPTTTTVAAPAALTEWCARAGEVRDVGDRFIGLDSVDPDVVHTAVSALNDAVIAAFAVAPAAIVDHVATQREFAERLDEVLAETDYDMLTADLSILDDYASDMDAARDAIRDYNVEFCGFSEPAAEEPVDDEPGFDFGEGSLRDQFIAQLVDDGFTQDEAECIYGEIDFSDPASYGDDEAVTEMFVACGLDLARISELLDGGGG